MCGFVQYGSKPSRDISDNEDLLKELNGHLRDYQEAVNYPPHQVFIGNRHPDDLNTIPKPWYEHPVLEGKRSGPFGEIMPEEEFYAWMKAADDFDLPLVGPGFCEADLGTFAAHPYQRG
jgi:betaine reductase